jgi:hypothetical protein
MSSEAKTPDIEKAANNAALADPNEGELVMKEMDGAGTPVYPPGEVQSADHQPEGQTPSGIQKQVEASKEAETTESNGLVPSDVTAVSVDQVEKDENDSNSPSIFSQIDESFPPSDSAEISMTNVTILESQDSDGESNSMEQVEENLPLIPSSSKRAASSSSSENSLVKKKKTKSRSRNKNKLQPLPTEGVGNNKV